MLIPARNIKGWNSSLCEWWFLSPYRLPLSIDNRLFIQTFLLPGSSFVTVHSRFFGQFIEKRNYYLKDIDNERRLLGTQTLYFSCFERTNKAAESSQFAAKNPDKASVCCPKIFLNMQKGKKQAVRVLFCSWSARSNKLQLSNCPDRSDLTHAPFIPFWMTSKATQEYRTAFITLIAQLSEIERRGQQLFEKM